MFTYQSDLIFNLETLNYTDNNCKYISSKQIVENSCNYTGSACCDEVQEKYNLSLNNCSDKIIYNCTIINPEDEIIIYVIFSLCLYCICCGALYIFWFFRKNRNRNRMPVYEGF